MTIGEIISVIRDAAILAALGYIVWLIHRSDQVADLQAVEKQLNANAAQESKWESQRETAETQRATDMQTITAAIAEQRTPVIVRFPSASPLPNAPPKASSDTACTGGAAAGSGSDIRPALDAFELKYEGALASCRSILKEWP